MSIQNLDFGTAADGDGESPYTAWPKVQANFESHEQAITANAAAIAAHAIAADPHPQYTTAAEVAAAYQPLDSDLSAIAGLSTNAAGRSALTLTDPNADRIAFWDDSAGGMAWLAPGAGITINGTTIEAEVATLANVPCADRSTIKALDTTENTVAYLTEAGREGMFLWRSGNYASRVTADTLEGVYLKANAVASSSGAWVRVGDTVTPAMFGAAGANAATDTAAIQAALNIGGHVVIPANASYIIAGGIEIPSFAKLEGRGGLITKTATTSYAARDGNNYNAAFVLIDGVSHASIQGIRITNSDGSATSVAFLTELVSNIDFSNIKISTFNDPFYQVADCFMLNLATVHCVSCGHGFDFSKGAHVKTTLDFSNCYAENCGSGFLLKNVQYSKLSACAADWINYVDASNPYNDGGHGSKSSSAGVYDFNTCKGVIVAGCGTENSFGNGGLRFNASNISVNGFRVYNLQSTFLPNYASFPNFYVGPIGSGTEAGVGSSLILEGVSIENWTNSTADADKQAVVAYNHLASTYGTTNAVLVEIGPLNHNTSLAKSGGLGPAINVVDKSAIAVSDARGAFTRYDSIRVTSGASKTTLNIPFTSQSARNRRALLRVSVVNNLSNDTSPLAGVAVMGVRNLTSVSVTSASVSGNIASVSQSGLNVVITLTTGVTDMLVFVEILSSDGAASFLDLANAALA